MAQMNENSFFSSQLYKDAADQVVAVMDKAQEKHLDIFGKPWYKKHFATSEYPRIGSEFYAILENVHAAPAASTINANSERPIRSLDGFGKVRLEMMTAAHTYKLEAEDLRAIAEMQRVYANNGYAKLLDYVFKKLLNVRERAIQGIMGNIDLRVLELLSNKGQFTFTQENDPNSPFIGTTLDFGFDMAHAAESNIPWTKANIKTVDVLDDIMSICSNATIKPTKMLMSRDRLMYMLSTDKLRLYVNGSDLASRPISKADLDNLLAQFELPTIEIVEREVLVEKDGGKTKHTIQPWNKNTILFVPDDTFGTIERRMTDNELGLSSDGVTYSNYEGIEVQKWQSGTVQNTQYTKFVSAELTYAPVVESIQNMYSLDTKSNG